MSDFLFIANIINIILSLKEGFLGVPKSEKPEFTNVNEDFEDEGNEKSTL